MWIFGYGSLIWKVDFPYAQKIIGYITGYERRFYQHSTDHRGIPEQPGRVVTLIPSQNNDRVYGIAYRINDADRDTVLNHLDYREKGGYKRTSVTFYPLKEEMEPFEILIYLATHDNPNYAGHADVNKIASQILKAKGPSGPNVDYVLCLARAMREIAPGVKDDHLFELEHKLLQLIEHDKASS